MNWRHLAVAAVFLAALAVGSAAQMSDDNVDTVILASTQNYPDALVASSAAAKTGTPVLLAEQNQVPQPTQNALQRLKPAEIIVIGGPAVISQQVAQSLSQDYNVTRLWGTTRYGTAVEVAEQFWVEGSDEAVLVQNSFEDQTGEVLAAAKELASEDETPLYLTPESSVPAAVLSSLQNLGVQEVTVVGTNVSSEYRTSLNEIGVSISETITGDTDDAVTEEVEDRVSRSVNATEELIVVASGGFKTSIAASHFPNSVTLHVRSEEKIGDAVATVQNQNVSKVKVVGRPQLAQSIADALRSQTDAEVELEVAEAADAIRLNANLTETNIPSFARAHRRKMQDWMQERERFQQRITEAANRTIRRADKMVDPNSSEEARDALQKAEVLFSAGNYVEAREEARDAISAVREERFEQMRGNYSAIRDDVREEVASLQEKVQELQELNQEFGQEMSENMTVEERLEVIDEFRNERREKVKELMEEARGTRGDIGERLRKAEKRFEKRDRGADRRFETDIECTDEQTTQLSIEGHDGRVQVEGTVGLSTPNYVPSNTVNVDRENNQVDVKITFAKRGGGLGIQCVANAEVEQRVGVPAGNWTVSLSVMVDGEETVSKQQTVTVRPDDDQAEKDTEDGMEQEQEMGDAGNESGEGSEVLPSSFTLESTDGTGGTSRTFYYEGKAVDEISVDAGKTSITFAPRAGGTYSAGAQFYSVPSGVFGKSDAVDGGGTTSVTFNASEDFIIEQWWPDKGQKKAEIKIDVE